MGVKAPKKRVLFIGNGKGDFFDVVINIHVLSAVLAKTLEIILHEIWDFFAGFFVYFTNCKLGAILVEWFLVSRD